MSVLSLVSPLPHVSDAWLRTRASVLPQLCTSYEVVVSCLTDLLTFIPTLVLKGKQQNRSVNWGLILIRQQFVHAFHSFMVGLREITQGNRRFSQSILAREDRPFSDNVHVHVHVHSRW